MLDNAIRKDQPQTDSSFLFKEMLKMRRREMRSSTRKRSRSPRVVVKWLYPSAQERQYRRYAFDLMNVYSEATIPVIRNNLQRWTEEYQRVDNHSIEKKRILDRLDELEAFRQKLIMQDMANMHAFSKIEISMMINNAETEEKILRSNLARLDDFQTEFQQLINRLEQTHFDMFDPKGKGVEEFNYRSILGTLATIGFGVSRFNSKQWEKVNKRIVGQSFIPQEPWLENAISVWARSNYQLIKSLSNEYIKELNRIVYDSVLDGRPWDAVMKDVRKMNKKLTKTRAKLLTRDQIGKLNGRLTKRRQQEAGIDMYRWLTANDERVRKPTHTRLHNKICRWDDDSVYADSIEDARKGKWKSRGAAGMYIGTPGQDIQCRCVAIPVYDDILREVDEELDEETNILEAKVRLLEIGG